MHEFPLCADRGRTSFQWNWRISRTWQHLRVPHDPSRKCACTEEVESVLLNLRVFKLGVIQDYSCLKLSARENRYFWLLSCRKKVDKCYTSGNIVQGRSEWKIVMGGRSARSIASEGVGIHICEYNGQSTVLRLFHLQWIWNVWWGGGLRHGIWVSLLHPTIFGHHIDYTLGNLVSKSIWTIPKFPGITIL